MAFSDHTHLVWGCFGKIHLEGVLHLLHVKERCTACEAYIKPEVHRVHPTPSRKNVDLKIRFYNVKINLGSFEQTLKDKYP